MKRLVLASLAAGTLALAVVSSIVTPSAQMRVTPLDTQQGHTALGLALRHLANVGIVMEATAHPDDEDNGLLVMLNRGQGFRTALVTATRGNGGQNEIGPEIFESLGVLRTEELAALHRFDGAEQYFTRAVDFGYSFSIDETFQKWGRDEITADYVRLIRTIRPDVIFGMSPAGNNGGQHHNASAVISHDAYKLAGDPTKYPEQIRDGLRPWQPKKYYWTAAFGPPAPGEEAAGKLCRINSSVYDSLLGRTYSEIGTEARSMHKCQGMAQLLALPGPVTRTYRLVETTINGQMQKDEKSLTDGIDSSMASLAQLAGPRPPKELVDGLASVSSQVRAAQQRVDAGNDDGAVGPLVAGLHAVRVLRAQLRTMTFDEAAKFDIEFRLRQKEREFQQAIIIANGLRIDALSDDGVVVPGQDVKLSLIVANNGAGEVGIRSAKFDGFTGDGACTLNQVTAQQGFGGGRGGRGGANAPPPVPVSSLKRDVAGRCDVTMKIPAAERASEPYWHRKGEDGRYTFDADAPFGLPFRLTKFYGQVTLGFPGVPGGPAVEEVYAALPVQYRYGGDIFSGEKRSDLLVVPALSVRVSPEVAIVPASSLRQPPPPPAPAAAGRGGRRGAPPAAAPAPAANAAVNANESREIRVTVVNGSPGASESVVSLDLPQGWTSTPAEQALKLARSDESQTLRFMVKPPIGTKAGEYHVRAVVKQGGATYDRGYQVIEYPHIRRQHIYEAANTTIKVIDVNVAANLTIGYVMGVGDQVPPAIEQLGAKVELISAEDLAWGNLSRFDAIVTGVRAYERRTDLRANNSRLLDYVSNGGTVIVQYNKFEFNDAQYGPYPAKVSNDRVTDEHAPIKMLIENDPLLNAPNRINEETWNGWVQERGLYFLGADHDSRYKDLLEISDGFEFNPGAKKGALVEAQYGKGRWVYVGLGLWRELPAGVDGAYQLLANLVSLGKTANLPPPGAPAGRGR